MAWFRWDEKGRDKLSTPYVPSKYQRPDYLPDNQRAHPGGNGWVDHGDFRSSNAGENARKADWHYARAGVVTKEGKMAKKRPGKFADAAAHDFLGQLKDL